MWMSEHYLNIAIGFSTSLLHSFATVIIFIHMKLSIPRTLPSSSFRSINATSKLQPFQRATFKQTRTMASTSIPIESTDIKTASGVELSNEQKTIVGAVLDLFAGRPSLEKLSLWSDDATFEDPLTVATGRKQYEAQWYGLQSAFSEIERQHHLVKSAGNPITMELRTRYVVKGIGKQQTIASIVNITTGPDGKIVKVEDKWDDKLPDSSFTNVSLEKLLSVWWWVHYAEGWAWWAFSFVWYTWPWLALRKLNAVTVPKMISVPKDKEEDAKRGN